MVQFQNLLDNLSILITAINGEPLIPAAAAAAMLVNENISTIKNQLPSLLSKTVKVS